MRGLLAMLVAVAMLTACATAREAASIPEPRTFTEALAIAQGQISAMRDTTVFVLQARGEDCANNPFTDLCAAARRIDGTTREYRDRIDQAHTAYLAVNRSLFDCQIEYGGEVIPCEDNLDQVLIGLIELRKLLPDGEK